MPRSTSIPPDRLAAILKDARSRSDAECARLHGIAVQAGTILTIDERCRIHNQFLATAKDAERARILQERTARTSRERGAWARYVTACRAATETRDARIAQAVEAHRTASAAAHEARARAVAAASAEYERATGRKPHG